MSKRVGEGVVVSGGDAGRPGRLSEALVRLARLWEETCRHAGELALLLWQTLVHLVRGNVPLRAVLDEMHWMGVRSLPIVIITALLSGVVTSQQGGYQFTSSIPLYVLGSVVTTSVVLELGPVLTAIVLIGRVGARITAEFGTMKVSEQIDALHSLGRDPVRVLAAPRIIAGVLVVPALVAIADLVGIFAGMVAAQATSGLGPEAFFYGARLYWHNWNLVYSMMKAVTFGLAIPLIASHMGFRIQGGAEGVGRGTTTSVMFMTLAILILDALFPPLFLN